MLQLLALSDKPSTRGKNTLKNVRERNWKLCKLFNKSQTLNLCSDTKYIPNFYFTFFKF